MSTTVSDRLLARLREWGVEQVGRYDAKLDHVPVVAAAAWDAALTADGPVVVEFRTDPAVPPIPSHATWEQMESTAAAILKGDSDRADMIKQGVKAKIQEFLPDNRKKAGEHG